MKKACPLPKSSSLPAKSDGFDLIEMMVDHKSMIREINKLDLIKLKYYY